jgi:hypothetical protein
MEKVRFLNKKINANERSNFNRWNKEQIEMFGQEVKFFSNLTSLSAADSLYGEDVISGFGQGKELVVLLNLNNDSYLLSKFGIVAHSDINGVIHPEMFEALFGTGSEPKAGDVIELTEFGADRIHFPKRGANVFELTEVIDEFQINPIAGHYLWFFKGRRYDYSHETGGPGAGVGNTSIDDNDALEQEAQNNFSYLENPCSNDSVYGDY